MTSCSKPPEYAEIEARFKELVAASAEVNTIFFGEGLSTYERVYDPQASIETFIDATTDAEGNETTVRYYYYEISDKTYGRVIAYRSSYLADYEYMQICTEPDATKETSYRNEKDGLYGYALTEYTEPVYEWYYDEKSDPAEYDYVRFDSKYTNINQIKELAEKVYSKDYLDHIYNVMFVGTVAAADSVKGLSARYIEFADENGEIYLMESNTYGTLVTETRQYDFSTAKMIKPSNAKRVNIEVESYMPSKPDDRYAVRISLLLQDGVWMLDSPTY